VRFALRSGRQRSFRSPSAQNYFHRVNPPASALWPGRKCVRSTRGAHHLEDKTRAATSYKAIFHRHFYNASEFHARAFIIAMIFCCVFAGDCSALSDKRRGGALTHKIKWSHCYFFPAVVIGEQCWSIRDLTAPMSPSTQARRAAMAKKRKTKAKKIIKKKKKKK
jgi:hypothetical protein